MTKDEAIKMLKHCAAESHCVDYKYNNCGKCNQRIAQDMAIEALKTDAIRYGTWIDHGIYADYHSEHEYSCSVCGKNYIGFIGEFDFCPNCGADMRGKKNDT